MKKVDTRHYILDGDEYELRNDNGEWTVSINYRFDPSPFDMQRSVFKFPTEKDALYFILSELDQK